MPNTPHSQSVRLPLGASLLLISSGCALNVNLNANRFESPETRGERFASSVGVATTGSNQLVPAPSPTWNRSNASLLAGANLGLFERLDIGLKVPWNGPFLLLAKYQLLGAPELQAQSGNFSVALTAGAGTALPSGTLTDPATGTNSHYGLSSAMFDFALIAGKRIAETFMIYGGPFVSTFNYSGTLEPAGGTASGFNGDATQGGANLGLQLDSVLGAIMIEEAWTLASVSGVHQAGFYTGARLSFRF